MSVCVDDIICWECLEDNRIVRIARDLGYDENVDYTEYDMVRKKQNEILEKHGLNPGNCWFNEERLGEEDYKEYCSLSTITARIIKDLQREEVDKCIDWLMDNGYALKVVKNAGDRAL